MGIPAEIEPKARQGAITDDSLSGLSEEARQELSRKGDDQVQSADESEDTLNDANEIAPDGTNSGKDVLELTAVIITLFRIIVPMWGSKIS